MTADFGKVFVSWRTEAELAAVLRDSARGEGLDPGYALPLAVGLIDRLLSRVRVMEATINGRFLGEEAAE
jgi:hypothetical protein